MIQKLIYRCPHCKKLLEYDYEPEHPTYTYINGNPKKWLESYCTSKERYARIQLKEIIYEQSNPNSDDL